MRQSPRSGRARPGWGNWFARTARGRRLDRNPLRRKSDRIETCVLAGSLAAAIAGAPFAGIAASQAAYAAAVHAEHAQLAASHEVRAVLLQSAGTAGGDLLEPGVPAQARWTSATGVTRTGEVLAPPGAAKGSSVLVWTSASGSLTTAPLQPGQAATQADLAAVAAVSGIGILYLCTAVITLRVLNRRRMAAWQEDWAVTEPMWNRQRW